MPVNCEPFEPMTFDIDLDCCIAKILCNGLVKYAFNLGTTKIVETGVSSYRISDGIDSWSIPSDQGGSYASDIAALWDAICICRSSGTLGEANLDRELVETCYDAIQNGTGYSIGDKITRVMILDVTTDPSTVESSIYINKTTGSAITGVLGDFQVCTGSGTCLDPVYVYDYRQPYCFNGQTVFRGVDVCTGNDPVYYDAVGNTVDVGSSSPTWGGCPLVGLITTGAVTVLNTDAAQSPLPDNTKKWSVKNDGATDLAISFDGGATYPLIVYLSTGIVSFGDGNSIVQSGGANIVFDGSGTSKYSIWWEV